MSVLEDSFERRFGEVQAIKTPPPDHMADAAAHVMRMQGDILADLLRPYAARSETAAEVLAEWVAVRWAHGPGVDLWDAPMDVKRLQ
ncbi:hypothetical protein [Streptomyces bambusae]|uniref:Uncharacterized protein n=1 Tax=Streptomyces bambusae TaxID=1550616 RepID=A0ABS6ZCH3_9ACTN|nr:hypothetical protein [Streptomyces bambusae]MBW5484938.1 hypothetical protein [Streptomyces bambusae]